MTTNSPEPRTNLVLHIEVPGVYADDLPASAAECVGEAEEPGPEDYLFVVTEEWMREEVGLTIVTLPGEKNLNEDFEIHAYTGRIVGAGVRDRSESRGAAERAAPDPVHVVGQRLEEVLIRDAEARGYARAVAVLRDDERFMQWWTAGPVELNDDPVWWDETARGLLADYLEVVGTEGGGTDG